MNAAVVHESMQSALSAALAHKSWADTIQGVKSIVVAHLSGMESGAKITTTPFFNHTFAPDITLAWEDSTFPPRQVFLRFPDDVSYLADNIGGDLPSGSMVVGLGELEKRDESGDLARISKEHETLVLDPQGAEALQVGKEQRASGVPVVTSAVARGGRGLFGRDKATTVTEVLTEGWRGATRAEVPSTQAAAVVSREDFAPREGVSLEHLLQTFWVAGGGQATEYPGEFHARARIGAEELKLLLGTEEISDLGFWRQVGADITIKELLASGESRIPSNVDRLIRANVDRLSVKTAWVKPEQRLKEPEEADYEWVLTPGLLRFKGPTFSAYFARKKERFNSLISSNRRDGITASTLLERAPGLGIREITQADTRRRLVFSTDDITQDSVTEQIAGSFGPDARITKAQATVASGTHVTVNFEDSTVVAVTNSNPPVGELARTAVQALVELDAESKLALDEHLSLPASLQPELLVGDGMLDAIDPTA